jgi:DNA-binding transcriptional MerR regulator
MTQSTTPNFSISQLADEFHVSTRTIRFYEEKGLLQPARTKGNQRKYSDRDRIRLRRILLGRRFGFSLDEMADIIGLGDIDADDVSQIRKALELGAIKLADLRQRIEELRLLEQDFLKMKNRLERRLEELESTDLENPAFSPLELPTYA